MQNEPSNSHQGRFPMQKKGPHRYSSSWQILLKTGHTDDSSPSGDKLYLRSDKARKRHIKAAGLRQPTQKQVHKEIFPTEIPHSGRFSCFSRHFFSRPRIFSNCTIRLYAVLPCSFFSSYSLSFCIYTTIFLFLVL